MTAPSDTRTNPIRTLHPCPSRFRLPVAFRVLALPLALANLLPILGIVWFGWDAFVLLSLYWLETAVLGF